MDDISNHDEAIELLQQLGLKEYEAKAFVALTRVPDATAKEISDLSEVPRTRVYDAVRVLESKGLVEIQHANPQLFRAVSVDEAVETLHAQYDARMAALRETLRDIEPASEDTDDDTHEVWALTGTTAAANRTTRLVEEADDEVVLVVGHESVVTDALLERLNAAHDRGVTVIVATPTESIRERIAADLADGQVFASGLDWIRGSELAGDLTEIGRILLVDRNAILVSTVQDGANGEAPDEHAVFGRGFENGFVTIVRRLMATGLLPIDDPGSETA